MKKLSLNDTWEQCLKMWKWISRQWLNTKLDALDLKGLWLEENGYGKREIEANCFFCHSCHQDCNKCPGRLIDADFDCVDSDYTYHKPRLFYAKLKQLDKIRLGK